jgi:hypothetical protein
MNDRQPRRHVRRNVVMSFAAAAVYYLSNPHPQSYYDYTFRVAGSFLEGRTGLAELPPSWLNEFIPLGDRFYSAFPLGSVLTMLPFAALKAIGLIDSMPGAFIAALCAGIVCFLLLAISESYGLEPTRQILLTSAMLFGTWLWVNLTFGGAWQLALGFAMIGELGAIYFSAVDRRPVLAGAFFALAFGNRTEVLLTAPIFMYLLSRNGRELRQAVRTIAAFSPVPVFLGLATLFYNQARFDSFLDFGYARIPGVLAEPWYRDGIFSIYYIPGQAFEMLIKPWRVLSEFPYVVPDGFSSSILISSPFLFLLARSGARDRVLKYTAWLAISLLTLLLWSHGNSGGWQFGYRYAIVLLPWAFVILLENSPKKITVIEWAVYGFSIFANLYAVWLFHWTDHVKR